MSKNLSILHTGFGSHVYGTNLPSSDHDFKQIFLPQPRDIVLGKVSEAFSITTKANIRVKNTADDVETEFLSLKKYMSLLLEGQTVALDILFTPESFYQEPPNAIWRSIQHYQKHWLHSGVLSFIGYARKQANKYGIKGSRVSASKLAMETFDQLIADHGAQSKLKDHWESIQTLLSNQEHIEFTVENMRNNENFPVRMIGVCGRRAQEHITLTQARDMWAKIYHTYGVRAIEASENVNVDWKACQHAVRIIHQAQELLATGHITFPRPEKDLLLQIRQGFLPYAQVAEMIEGGMEGLEQCQSNSSLPREPNYAFANDFVAEMYLDHIKQHG